MPSDLIERVITNSLHHEPVKSFRASSQFHNNHQNYCATKQPTAATTTTNPNNNNCFANYQIVELKQQLNLSKLCNVNYLEKDLQSDFERLASTNKNFVIISRCEASEAPPCAKYKNQYNENTILDGPCQKQAPINSDNNKDVQNIDDEFYVINSEICKEEKQKQKVQQYQQRGSTATLCDFRRHELRAQSSPKPNVKRKARSEGRSSETGSQLAEQNRQRNQQQQQQQRKNWATSMFASSISNNKLHCSIFVLILFLVIFLLVPLKLIANANEKIQKSIRREGFKLTVDISDFNCTKFATAANFTFAEQNGEY